MTQRGRKTNSRAIENNGGNALFTMGLITVVALLIVGWVMTQGGWQPLAERGEGVLNLPFNAPPQESSGMVVMQPSPTPQANAALSDMIDTSTMPNAPAERMELDELTRLFQNQLQQQEQSFEQQIEQLQQELRKSQQELNDLKLELRLLQMENNRLRGES